MALQACLIAVAVVEEVFNGNQDNHHDQTAQGSKGKAVDVLPLFCLGIFIIPLKRKGLEGSVLSVLIHTVHPGRSRDMTYSDLI